MTPLRRSGLSPFAEPPWKGAGFANTNRFGALTSKLTEEIVRAVNDSALRKALAALSVLLGCWTPAAAANLTGQWSLDLIPDFGGTDNSVGCAFQQDGDTLTINCGAGPNIRGEIDGRKITLRLPTGRKNELVAMFVGELDQREASISGTWRLANDHGPSEGKFLLKKISGK